MCFCRFHRFPFQKWNCSYKNCNFQNLHGPILRDGHLWTPTGTTSPNAILPIRLSHSLGVGALGALFGGIHQTGIFFTEARAHIEQGTCEKVRIDVSKVCAHRAHITCMPRAYRVHAACRPRAYHMHIPCIPCAYHMCTKCIPHAYHVDTTWIPRVYQNIPRAYCVHTTSTPRACHVRAACIPNAYHVHTTRIHLTCTVCTRYTPTAYHMHTTCTPSRSTSTIDHLAEGIA